MIDEVVIVRAGTTSPRIVAELIDDDTPGGGIGGWEVVARPGRPPLTRWTGVPGLTWALPITLDRFDDDQSVERLVERLKAWGAPADDADEPPALNVTAPLGRGPSTGRWVIDSIEWGAQARNAAGERTRQDLVLNLIAYVPGRVLKGPAAKSRDAGGKRHKWVAISAKDRRCKVCKRPRNDKRHTNRSD